MTFNEIETALRPGSNTKLESGNYIFSTGRILIADDKRYNRELLREFLQQYNFELKEAVNGKEVLDCLDSFRPELIFLDMKMPVINGYDVAKQMRKIKSATPVIAVTASALKQDEELISSICDGYIPKPIDFSRILQTLCKYFDYTNTEELPGKSGFKDIQKEIKPFIERLDRNPGDVQEIIKLESILSDCKKSCTDPSLGNWLNEFNDACSSLDIETVNRFLKTLR